MDDNGKIIWFSQKYKFSIGWVLHGHIKDKNKIYSLNRWIKKNDPMYAFEKTRIEKLKNKNACKTKDL